MNKKIDRQEFLEIRELAGTLIILALVYITIPPIFIFFSKDKAGTLEISVISLIICAMGVIISMMLMVGRYHKLLFTNKGYIKMALPVKNSVHLNVNIKYGLLSAYILTIITFLGSLLADLCYGKGNEVFGLIGLYKSMTGMEAYGSKSQVVVMIIINSLLLLIAIAWVYLLALSVVSGAHYCAGRFNVQKKDEMILLFILIVFNIAVIYGEAVVSAAEIIRYLTKCNAEPGFMRDCITSITIIIGLAVCNMVLYIINKKIVDEHFNL